MLTVTPGMNDQALAAIPTTWCKRVNVIWTLTPDKVSLSYAWNWNKQTSRQRRHHTDNGCNSLNLYCHPKAMPEFVTVNKKPAVALGGYLYEKPGRAHALVRSYIVDPRVLTSTVIDLARAIHDNGDWEHLPILADALADAGCEDRRLLGWCRDWRRDNPALACHCILGRKIAV